MFEFKLNKEIQLNLLIELLFDINNGDKDQECLDILTDWLNDKELLTQFKFNSSLWDASPDLGAFDLQIINDNIILTFEVGVMTEDGYINADIAEFHINKNKIYKFVFYSDVLDD